MNKIIQIIAASAAAICGFLFGEFDGLMYALIAFMVLDYISGVLVAIAQQQLSSKVGFKGIAKKSNYSCTRSCRTSARRSRSA